ncbi:MAG: D-alanyl-D-alanine carboxypeptidase, partial [Thermodesulfobacteriota bacterium]|nr:D-alanyl-D-alanine carboxypeptidase [Thermodesulfobacteriota bacterium]
MPDRTGRAGRAEIIMFCHGLKVLAAALALMVLWTGPGAAYENGWRGRVRALARGGAVMAADAAGNILLAHNPDKLLVPASTLKIVTAASALDALGPDYRFVTEFRLSPGSDLYVIGQGDPFLVSEELAVIARKLKSKGLAKVNRIFLDNSFFQKGLALHGTGRSLNPYDAYNGALCANFNTIFVRAGPGRKVVSAEPQ